MKGLVLSGGKGTRLRPITHTINKHLIPLANKPMIHYPIETLRNAGITDIGIIVGHTEEKIKEIKNAIGDGSQFGVKVTYIEQDVPGGLAHAVKVAKEFLMTDNPDKKFILHLGDNIVKGGIKKYVESFENGDMDSIILLKDVPNPSRFGVAEIKDGKIVRLVEKPTVAPNNFALVGIYMFNDSIFDPIENLKPSWRNELEITDAIQGLIDSGKKVVHHIIDVEWWKDPGDTEGILEANSLLLDDIIPFNKGTVEEGAVIIGKVGIDEGTIIKSGSSVKGPALIGKNCVIGKNAYIGPHTSIGNNTVIENAEIESSVIIGDSKISCKQRIIDSLIGRNVTISEASENLPRGASQLVVGEHSVVKI
ncbi:MAG: glucose-1-phosphate thymidylyltransferase [Candidatus Aenigmarchaeota archaeon]|nr:glucose-1-phosphate thymidylyltransferase [Candidatus Aenigmarchaeota archaeon]